MKEILCKKTALHLLCLCFVLGIMNVTAAELEVAEGGEIRIVVPTNWNKAGVVVAPEAVPFPEAVARAYKTPNQEVVLTWKIKYQKTKFWYLTKIKEGNKAVVYDKENNIIHLTTSTKVVKDEKYDLPLILIGISVICILVMFMLLYKNKSLLATSMSILLGTVDFVAAVKMLEDIVVNEALLIGVGIFVAVILVGAIIILHLAEEEPDRYFLIYLMICTGSLLGLYYFYLF